MCREVISENLQKSKKLEPGDNGGNRNGDKV